MCQMWMDWSEIIRNAQANYSSELLLPHLPSANNHMQVKKQNFIPN